ncbi:hypothetical protein [Roseisolibacter agri]|nr:hypothetical protein [Roseisolibacter agri]
MLTTLGLLCALLAGTWVAGLWGMTQFGTALGRALSGQARLGQCATCTDAPAGAVVLLDGATVATIMQVGRTEGLGGEPRELYLARWHSEVRPDSVPVIALYEVAAGAPRLRLVRRPAPSGVREVGALHFTTERPPIPVFAQVVGRAAAP